MKMQTIVLARAGETFQEAGHWCRCCGCGDERGCAVGGGVGFVLCMHRKRKATVEAVKHAPQTEYLPSSSTVHPPYLHG